MFYSRAAQFIKPRRGIVQRRFYDTGNSPDTPQGNNALIVGGMLALLGATYLYSKSAKGDPNKVLGDKPTEKVKDKASGDNDASGSLSYELNKGVRNATDFMRSGRSNKEENPTSAGAATTGSDGPNKHQSQTASKSTDEVTNVSEEGTPRNDKVSTIPGAK
ncbi:hypothetical protein G6F70_008425 [Rhizopus microsporus]|uniref:Uncharacterized protein n=1 Tax=Rhizopus microsporus TaxID=58291 RepID=A0A0A1NAW7_RHIZD|nr:hypothetical protein G6F71_007833 [Rhizopus microsporus]KAG1195182.1 hypothetical protein G6F70_008425 [Rhizopus microsporus]KAG1207006.1 hypothetical protein G6F69_008399 [Rhizopus microsporus]KAG1235142.1 hypothetical protein G6F67_003007 [Rhizopus microsporus]KAG1259503.1 hypothetical protein G6F68_008073 [Rhizopus microsporus]